MTDPSLVVYPTKWNTSTMHSDSIGGGVGYAIGTLSGGQALNIPLDYFSALELDTAYVFVRSSLNSPVDSSFIKIDDLGFGAANSLAEQDQVPNLRIIPSSPRTCCTWPRKVRSLL